MKAEPWIIEVSVEEGTDVECAVFGVVEMIGLCGFFGGGEEGFGCCCCGGGC